MIFQRKGQSLIEILVAIGVGVIMLVGAITALVPVIKSSSDVNRSQIGAALAKELLDNIRVFAEGSWHNIDTLATTSANKYFLSTATSSFQGISSYPSDVGSGIDSILTDGFPTGTIGYWKMNDALNGASPIDFSGYRNILLASASWPVSTSGKYGNGFYFDGGSHYLYTSGSLPGSTSYTFIAWVKTSSTSTPIFSNKRGGGTLVIGVDATGKEYSVDSGCSSSTITGSMINDNAFHQLVYVRDGSANIKNLYLDGTLTASSTSTGCSAINNVFDIAHDATPNTYFTGVLDEARIFGRALSGSEISAIYNAVPFYRDFYVDDVYRDSGGNIVTVGGGLDPSTKKITVEYYWGQIIPKTLSIYLTRSADTSLWQTDWSAGATASGTTSVIGNRFTTSSNIDYTTSTGAIRIFSL